MKRVSRVSRLTEENSPHVNFSRSSRDFSTFNDGDEAVIQVYWTAKEWVARKIVRRISKKTESCASVTNYQ